LQGERCRRERSRRATWRELCQGQQTAKLTGMFQCNIAHCSETVQVLGGVLSYCDRILLNCWALGEQSPLKSWLPAASKALRWSHGCSSLPRLQFGTWDSHALLSSPDSVTSTSETWLWTSLFLRISVCVDASQALPGMDMAKDTSVLPELEPWGVLRRLRTRSPEDEFNETGVDPSAVAVVNDKEEDCTSDDVELFKRRCCC